MVFCLTQYILSDFDIGILKELVNKSFTYLFMHPKLFQEKKRHSVLIIICIIRNWKLNARNSTTYILFGELGGLGILLP